MFVKRWSLAFHCRAALRSHELKRTVQRGLIKKFTCNRLGLQCLKFCADMIETKTLRLEKRINQQQSRHEVWQVLKVEVVPKRDFGATTKKATPIVLNTRQIRCERFGKAIRTSRLFDVNSSKSTAWFKSVIGNYQLHLLYQRRPLQRQIEPFSRTLTVPVMKFP